MKPLQPRPIPGSLLFIFFIFLLVVALRATYYLLTCPSAAQTISENIPPTWAGMGAIIGIVAVLIRRKYGR